MIPQETEKKPKISCVVPCLNAEKFIKKSLESILPGCRPGDEVIAVYDQSTDKTRSILRSYEPTVRVVELEKPTRRAAISINRGFEEAKGDIFCWLGADDLMFPWTLAVVRSVFAKFENVNWITSTYPCVMKGESVISKRIDGLNREYFLDGFTVPGARRGAAWIQQESTFWRRNLWMQAGGKLNEDLKIAFDLDLWARFFRHSSIFGVESLLGCFRYREGQLSSNYDAIQKEAFSILQNERKESSWHKSVIKEVLFALGRKRTKEIRNIALHLSPFSWKVAYPSEQKEADWFLKDEKFWPY